MMKIFVLFIFSMLAACVPKTSQTTSCSAGQTYQEASRRCIASIAAVVTPSSIRQPPITLVSSVSYSVTPREDTAFTATLGYSDANLDPALNCVVTATSAIAQTSTCTCTTAGVCTVSFLGVANTYGAASFTYYVIDRDGQSIAATANLTLASLDDAPVAISGLAVSSNEDVMTSAVLTYSDIDGDIATSCTTTTIVPYSSEVSFPFGCNCVAGACSAFALPATNFNGTTYFWYTVTANGQTSNSGIASFAVTAVNDAPVASAVTQGSILEDTAGTATFTVSDVDGSAPYTCTVFNETNLAESTACSCSSTTCTVGLTPNSNLNSNSSSFSFDYTVTDASAATSSATTKAITVTAVDDAPISGVSYTSLSPATPAEDPVSGVAVSLSYSDVDLDLATACTLTNVGNGSAGACTCSGSTYPNSCSFTFTPTANINGTNIASFTYTITSASTSSTTPVAVTFSLTPVNDAPTIATPSSVTYNEATPFDITAITVDEGGGIDENTQIVSVVASSSNPALIPNNQITLNFNDTGDAGNIPLSLHVVPINGSSGTAVITLTATDNGTPAKSKATFFTVTINNISYLHTGWKNVKALGVRTNSSGTVQENPSVTLEWEAFTPSSSASLAGYKVYRSTTSGGQDFNSPLTCNSSVNTCSSSTLLSSQATKFVDALPSSLGSGITYYYVIRPVDSNGLESPSTEVYAEIDVPVPPANMVLLHKWIANKEACEKLGATIDPDNSFRCAYTGPGSNGGYYQLANHLFVDRFEAGCNYSRAPKCSSNGCIGITTPTAVLPSIAAGDLYYNRVSGVCSVYDGTAWQTFSSNLGSWSGGLDREPNISNLPPLLSFTQAQATSYCSQTGRDKRLMTRLEQIAVSAWRTDLETAKITSLESGLLLSTSLSCNTMSGTGLTYSNGAVPTSGNEDTLPATNNTSTLRLVQTGSTATAACVSRYGAQDLVGNVREWTKDTFGGCTVGDDGTGSKATLTNEGITYTAKKPGTRGNFIYISKLSVASGSETVTVTETTNAAIGAGALEFTQIEIKLVAGTTTATQVSNLLNANTSVAKLIDFTVNTGTTTQTAMALPTALAGGVDGSTSMGNILGSFASLTLGADNFIAKVPGIAGNTISIEILDLPIVASPQVVVTDYDQIKVYISAMWVPNGAYWVANAIQNHSIANSLLNSPFYVGDAGCGGFDSSFCSTLGPTSKANLASGGYSYCQGTSTDLTNYNSPFGYSFDGNTTLGNGPGNKQYSITSWLLGNTDANTFSSSYFHVPIGLPSINSYDGALLIGGSSLPSANLSADQIDVNTDPLQKLNSTGTTVYSASRGIVTGGAWYGAYDRSTGTQSNTGDKAGRYTMDLMPTTLQDNYTGFRCVKTVP